MSTPQQPELARSRRSAVDPSSAKATAGETPNATPEAGAVPEDNRPGHHPDREQDQPDLDAFAARLGTVGDTPTDDTVTDAEDDEDP